MTRPNFRPILTPPAIDNDRIEELADKLGVPKLVTPEAETPISDQIRPVDKPEAQPRPTPPKREKPTSVQKKRLPAGTMKFSAQIPVYVSQAINERAAQERCTVRHLLLLGMQAIGISIDAADLIPDGRRPKN